MEDLNPGLVFAYEGVVSERIFTSLVGVKMVFCSKSGKKRPLFSAFVLPPILVKKCRMILIRNALDCPDPGDEMRYQTCPSKYFRKFSGGS